MLFKDTPIHYDLQAAINSLLGRRFINHPFLKPDGGHPNFNGFIDYGHHCIGVAKDIDNVDFAGNRFQIGIGFYPKDFWKARVNRYDFVFFFNQVTCHSVRWSIAFGRKSYHRNSLASTQKLRDLRICGIGKH